MSINPVHFNGMIQNNHQVGNIKHNEDMHPVAEQTVITKDEQKKVDNMSHKVNNPERKNAENDSDAKDEGKNKYFNQRKDNNKHVGTDRVIPKRSQGSFDISI